VSEYPDLKATHWRSESIYHATVETGFLDYHYAEVSTDAEVPMAGEVRVRDQGNRYWPTTVKVEGPDVELNMMPEHARQFANAILRAADVAEAHDLKDVGACGHWTPCPCVAESGR
jgi:O-acetyl-ADP-ribose deacetylase (regulator of RNase III)